MPSAPAAMNRAEIYSFLQQVFAEVFGRDDIVIHPCLTAADVVGWDSFRQVEITLAMEERFAIRIRTKELNNLTNVGDLVTLVLQKTGGTE